MREILIISREKRRPESAVPMCLLIISGHIGLAIQGLTEASREEKLRLLQLMRDTDGGKGMMHEGFHVDDPSKYTREWFSWANAVFCELVLDYCQIRVKK